MEVSAASSQSAALADYITQQNQRLREQTTPRPETANESQSNTQTRDQVSLSTAAQQLAQTSESGSRQETGELSAQERVNATRETQSPEEARSASAKSVAQAINAYLETSIV